jgi:hypothetical protein
MRGHRDLELVVGIAIASALLGLVVPVEWISLLAAAPLLLVLPGYALASAAFARRPRGLAQFLVLTLGLSLAVLALGSLLLNFLPGGLRAGSWAILLVLVTAAGCREAALRRRPAQEPPLAALKLPRPRPLRAGLVLAGVALAAVAFALAFIAFKAPDVIGYTELWIRPAKGDAAVRVGVGSQEQETHAYKLVASYGGGQPFATRSFSLDPGKTKTVRLAVPAAKNPRKVVAALYRADRPGRPYRRVTEWVVPEGGG